MVKAALKAIGRPIWKRVQFRINVAIDRRIESDRAEIARLKQATVDLQKKIDSLYVERGCTSEHFDLDKRIANAIEQRIFVPSDPVLDDQAPFMQYSTCSAADMLHPEHARVCAMLCLPPMYQRKFWEWTYIIHHLNRLGMLTPGRRGLGFGVGQERLPALFAKLGCFIVATDAPPEIGQSSGWSQTGQHSNALNELRFPNIVADEIFDRAVTHQHCDMNAIAPSLRDFDFNWSSCCFEHLGNLEAGLQFVINSMDTLKPGGVAVHTTEYNLSSNDDTSSEGGTVIYRKRDMEELVMRLRNRGYEVESFAPAPHAHALDFHVDAPPYSNNPHLKLRLAGYTTTSAGICIRRSA
ncbi:hypothetical protein WJ12_07775 [Burkholderia seminalis]|uniref:Uncharacterized protein n=2 Tax=Burkholderia cepacia complex TaxID=87882 RepID=A0A071MHM8_9BURK|nr:hypothetical protein WJ12_07775 [Burkholderia seminalis]KVF48651.1 hypothetical protein WJ13_16490 [Burkholderia seminalis]MBJ9593256.1 hypothetical protein [Burkholderia seminalis]QTO20269.1 hypothetical protein DT99_008065 [Burkholderia seminalis]